MSSTDTKTRHQKEPCITFPAGSGKCSGTNKPACRLLLQGTPVHVPRKKNKKVSSWRHTGDRRIHAHASVSAPRRGAPPSPLSRAPTNAPSLGSARASPCRAALSTLCRGVRTMPPVGVGVETSPHGDGHFILIWGAPRAFHHRVGRPRRRPARSRLACEVALVRRGAREWKRQYRDGAADPAACTWTAPRPKVSRLRAPCSR